MTKKKEARATPRQYEAAFKAEAVRLWQSSGQAALRPTGSKEELQLEIERLQPELTRVSEGDAVRIVDREGKVIFEAVVRGRPELSSVPDDWRRQVCAMRRGLDHALSAQPSPLRQPRPRIVPPAPQVKE